MGPAAGQSLRSCLLALAAVAAAAIPAAAGPRLALRPGDRVALVGGGFVEREQDEGYIETALTAALLGRAISFRNFAWTGDTAASRPRPRAMPSLERHLDAFAPTVVVVGYGAMEAFEGEAGLPAFLAAYEAFVGGLARRGARLVLLSPPPHEAVGGRFPDPAARNRTLARYTEAIARVAARRGHLFVDLFSPLRRAGARLTTDGLHLSPEGYQRAAAVVTGALGLRPARLAPADREVLRAAIKRKNRLFFHHYRPMNAEYVWGSRAGNQQGLADEVARFAALAAAADREIAALGRSLLRGRRLRPAPEPPPPRATPATPDPEEERRRFQVAEGFEVNLFAADPAIDKPVQMAFDARGRLWVATTRLYPQIRPGEAPTDRIVVLEDADGDGRADRRTVFASDLTIPTGVLPARDGAYTLDDGTLVFLRDTDGDGRADRREVVLAGFGTEDSHHKAHTFRFTPTGKIRFQQGIFLHSTVETVRGLLAHPRPGIFEYDPGSGALGLHLANSTPVNPWGHYWNRWGFDFFVDSSHHGGHQLVLPTAGSTSSHLPVPGGSGKIVGPEVISGRHFPPDWQGNVVAGRFLENRVARWAVTDDGAGYAFKELAPLVVSTDPAFRPVEMRMGPDGALYIADWYNPLIGHTQHHLHDPRRDFTHGRIWRVTARGRPLVPRPELVGVPLDDVAARLADPEDHTRAQARRVLAESPREEALAAVRCSLASLDPGAPAREHHRIEALWVQASHQGVDPDLHREALASRDPDARAAAVALLREPVLPGEARLAALAAAVGDPHPRVRLAAVVALGHVPEARAVEIAVRVLDLPLERHIEAALEQTIVALEPRWSPALARGELDFGGAARHRDHVLRAAAQGKDIAPLVSLVAEWRLGGPDLDAALAAVARRGSAHDLGRIYAALYGGNQVARIFDALAAAARERGVRPTVDTAPLRAALEDRNESVAAAAARLAGAWGLEGFRADLVRLAERGRPRVQRGALEALAALGDLASLERLAVSGAAAVRPLAVAALAAADPGRAARHAVRLLREPLDDDAPARLFDAFAGRSAGLDALAAALEGGPIAPDAAKIGLRRLQETGRSHPALAARLGAALGLDATPVFSAADVAALAAAARTRGDAARGERAFRRPELSCFACHAIGGAGGHLGPDLATVGSGSTLEYLAESLLLPHKVVKDNYDTLEVTTRSGESVLGVLVRESPDEIVLKDAVRPHIALPLAAIASRRALPSSLMPEGLTLPLTSGELADLVRFLSELGKPGPFAHDPRPVVRRWRVVEDLPPALAQVPDAELVPALPGDLPLAPAYALVSGLLPPEALRPVPGRRLAVALAELDVTTGGVVALRVNDGRGLALWVGRKPVPLQETILVPLARGRHTLAFTVDPAARAGEGLRVELVDAPGADGRAGVVGGR